MINLRWRCHGWLATLSLDTVEDVMGVEVDELKEDLE